ncbi:hypothetical protein ACQVP2_07635 [Methylobacterium aquaticum]|uniref:hypothetical protein n=1 Tax=Methylobacterium aquaticum TaxID=270351 RepID=UPI003D167018
MRPRLLPESAAGALILIGLAMIGAGLASARRTAEPAAGRFREAVGCWGEQRVANPCNGTVRVIPVGGAR